MKAFWFRAASRVFEDGYVHVLMFFSPFCSSLDMCYMFFFFFFFFLLFLLFLEFGLVGLHFDLLCDSGREGIGGVDSLNFCCG